MSHFRDLSTRICEWYNRNGRDLPWRRSHDPYHIWLSEIILQQTRVNQGLPYYHRFIDRFPTIKRLAAAPETEVLKLWQGLGYYSRARNLHHTARFIAQNYNGKFPACYEEIRALRGVGDYTAAAIASFAFGLPYAAVDGNVYRFLSRYFGVMDPVDSLTGKRICQDLATSLLPSCDPATHNQAMMEFGATVCRPMAPLCTECPFVDECHAFRFNITTALPVKSNRPKTRIRYFSYLFIKDDSYVYLNKRTGKDIWKNLYDLPLIETDHEISPGEIIKSDCWIKLFGQSPAGVHEVSNVFRHKLSHQEIHARFYTLNYKRKLPIVDFQYEKVHFETLSAFPVPRLIENYFRERLPNYTVKQDK